MMTSRFALGLAAAATFSISVSFTLLAAPDTGPATRPATNPAATAAAARAAAAKEKAERLAAESLTAYEKLADAYMHNRWPEIDEGLKYYSGHPLSVAALPADKRPNIEYMRRIMQDVRPAWWKQTKSSVKTSFQSSIWGKNVPTNYVPSGEVGLEMTLPIVQNGHFVMLVTWRPNLVDNVRPADGTLAKRLGITKSDIGEVIVWHELGHNYISANLPAETVLELFENHALLYAHLQEFYADMTALYHSSAEARPVTLLARLDAIDPPPPEKYREAEPHTRESHGIGALFLFEVLSDPKKWPHVHLPGKIPDGDAELPTIIYMYEHWDKGWSVTEDRQLHDFISDVIHNNGMQIFRSKGMIPLKEGNTFSLMEVNDRDFAEARDKWIKDKLKKAIAAGLTDKPEVAEKPARGAKVARIEVENY